VEPLTRGLPPPDPRSLCPVFSTEFVEPPLPEKIPGYAIALNPFVETSSVDSKLDPFMENFNFGNVKTEVHIPPQLLILGPKLLIGHAVWEG
jgi:hypothetical protein